MADDVLTIGRIGVDLYPLQVGARLEDVETFGKFLGGSATNVAVAAARHGQRSAVISRTGNDPFGTFIHRTLRELGVDDRYVTPVDGLPTPITFCEIFPPDDFPLYFYRYPKAPDLVINPDELDLTAIRDARIYWSTVTGLSAEPSRSAHFAAWQARSGYETPAGAPGLPTPTTFAGDHPAAPPGSPPADATSTGPVPAGARAATSTGSVPVGSRGAAPPGSVPAGSRGAAPPGSVFAGASGAAPAGHPDPTSAGTRGAPAGHPHLISADNRRRVPADHPGLAPTGEPGRRFTVLDLDWRPMFWADPAEARDQVSRALEHCNVAVGNREECEVAVGETDPDKAAQALLDRGLDLAVVKQGPKGTLARTRHERVEVPPTPVEVVNGLGAGDSFGGALCHGLLAGWPLEKVIRFANTAGAIVASRLECSTAMPTTEEVEALLGDPQ